MSDYKAKPRWTYKQMQFLQDNFGKMHDAKIAEVLGRTEKAVKRKRAEMELKKMSGRGRCEADIRLSD